MFLVQTVQPKSSSFSRKKMWLCELVRWLEQFLSAFWPTTGSLHQLLQQVTRSSTGNCCSWSATCVPVAALPLVNSVINLSPLFNASPMLRIRFWHHWGDQGLEEKLLPFGRVPGLALNGWVKDLCRKSRKFFMGCVGKVERLHLSSCG